MLKSSPKMLSSRFLLQFFLTFSAAAALVRDFPPRNDLAWDTSSELLPPSKDPFYTAPKSFEAARPGTVLRFRTAPGNLTSIVSNTSSAYQILYRTTDSNRKPSWAVTTLLTPKTSYKTHSHAASKPALLSYQIPYDSANVDASPSAIIYDPALNTTLVDMTVALGLGWFVNTPDYEGPLAAFSEGLQSGYATLDSVRAVLELTKLCELGLSEDVPYAMWGYSGGSIATEWAAELQRSYAPDLNFAGAIVGGAVTNFQTAIEQMTGTSFAGLVVSGLLGLTAEFPNARKFLVSHLKTTGPYNATTFLAALDMQLEEVLVTFLVQNVSDYFVDGEADIFAPPIVDLLNSQGVMGQHGVPRMPTFFYKAIGDEVVPVGETDALVDKYCGEGANILYERNTVGEHASEFQNGHTRALDFLSSVFFDKSFGLDGCTIRNVTVVDPTGPVL